MVKGKMAVALAVFACMGFWSTVCAAEAADEIIQQIVETAPSAGGTAQQYASDNYGASLAPQRIIVEATRIPTPIENVPGSVSVVNSRSAMVEARQYRNATELLQTMPGVSMNATGGKGTTTEFRVRGLSPGYTQVLVDGMPMNDPSTIGNTFDFADMTLDNLGQFELLRGPQSMSYGSAGVAGVVNVTSKKGEGPLSGFVSSEAGSRGTVITRLGVSAGTDKVDFSLGGSYWRTDGISALDKNQYGMPWRYDERDGYDMGNLSLRLGANPTDLLRLDLVVNGQVSEVELDGTYSDSTYTYYPFDDPTTKQRTERFMIRPQATLALLDGRWEQKIGFGYVQTIRKMKDDRDDVPIILPGTPPFTTDPFRSRYEGYTTKFDYQSIFHLHESNSVVAGIDATSEWMKKQDTYYGPGRTPKNKYGKVTTTGMYVEDQITIGDRFFATVGVRNDHHDEFGDYVTWRASAMYRFPTETRIKASAGSGFKAPSLYQLYGDESYFIRANHDLEPEKSKSWDIGFEQSVFCDRLNFGATYFENRVSNMIDYYFDPITFESYYDNRNTKVKSWGVESFVNLSLTDTLSVSGQYTWTRAIDRETKTRMRRIPLHEASINLDWRFLEKGTLSPGVRYVGRRTDRVYNSRHPSYGNDITMSSHVVARIAVAWQFNDRVEVFGRVENLFNKKYQEIYQYGTERISFFAGAKISF